MWTGKCTMWMGKRVFRIRSDGWLILHHFFLLFAINKLEVSQNRILKWYGMRVEILGINDQWLLIGLFTSEVWDHWHFSFRIIVRYWSIDRFRDKKKSMKIFSMVVVNAWDQQAWLCQISEETWWKCLNITITSILIYSGRKLLIKELQWLLRLPQRDTERKIDRERER